MSWIGCAVADEKQLPILSMLDLVLLSVSLLLPSSYQRKGALLRCAGEWPLKAGALTDCGLTKSQLFPRDPPTAPCSRSAPAW